MDFYRCENPDCGFVAEVEPDICPRCGGTFFAAVTEEEAAGTLQNAAHYVELGREQLLRP